MIHFTATLGWEPGWALAWLLLEILGKESLFKRWVVGLQVIRQSLLQGTVSDVIEDAVLERVIKDRILLLVVVNLRDCIVQEGVIWLFASGAE